MRVLGIETSCDDTGVAIYDTDRGLLADTTYSQSSHKIYGGVVPEIASRDHVQKVIPLIDALLQETQLATKDIDGIAYTKGPGLAGSLMVGATVAQGLALAWQCPTIGIHHLEGHLLAPMLSEAKPQLPFMALLISGGHTQIIRVNDLGDYEILGESLDDAVGEAFDKTAKLLGLPYPGGPHLEQLARDGDASAYRFPRPLLKRNDLNFSFSGLKTHVANIIHQSDLRQQDKANIAAQFEETIADVLSEKVRRAMTNSDLKQLVVAGGVAANQTLNRALHALAKKVGFAIFFPPLKYCTDNGAMIAYAGALRLARGEKGAASIAVKARWPLNEINA